MVEGGFAYYVCNVLALLIMFKYMICQLAIIMDHDAGHKMAIAAKGILFTLLSVVGFACWWGITGASFSASCEDDDVADDLSDGDAFEVCAGSGAIVSIVAFAFTFLAGALAIANAFMQKDTIERKYSDDVPMCCGPKIHMGIALFAAITCFVLGFVGFFVHWVRFGIDQGNIDEDYDGTLLMLKDVDVSGVNLDYYSWDCMAVAQCDLDDDTTNCKTFEPLMDAGGLYILFEIINMFFLLTWMAFLSYVLCKGREWSHPMIVYSLPNMAWLFHLIAVICWTVISKARFRRGGCDNDDTDADEAYDVCSREGPIMAIVQLIIQIGAAVHFSLMYFKRGSVDATQPATKG